MTVSGTIEVGAEGDEAFLQTASGYDHAKMRCPVCGPSYPREKILEVTVGPEVVKVKTPQEYRDEAQARKDKFKDPSVCPYQAGDQVRVLFKGLGWVHAKEEEQTVARVTPTGSVRLSDGHLYRPHEHRGEVEYRYWSSDGGSHGKILGPT